MKSRVLCIVLLLSVAQVFAQKKMTLKQCVEYGLVNHRSVKVYNNDIRTADEKGYEALSYYLPQVAGNVTFDDNLKRQTTILPGALAGQPGQDLRVQFGQQFVSGAVIQVDQTIYDQSMINSLKAIKPTEEISRLRKEQNDQQLIYNASAAYCEALIYQEKIKILVQNEKKYNELSAITKFRYEKGVVQKIEYDRVTINLRNITAEKTMAETNKEMSLNRLKNAMGMPLEEQIDIDSLDYNRLIQMSEREANFDVTRLLDYRIQSGNLTLQEVDLKRKRSAFLPTLTAYGRYGVQAYANEFSKVLDNKFDYSAIGLKLTVPIFSGLRRSSQANQSSLALKSAKENLMISNDNLKLQYQNTNTRLTKSLSDLNTNQSNLALAKQIFETTSFQYQKGTAMMSDVINADYSLKEAQNNYITAILNVLSSTLQYEQSRGTLVEYFNKF